MTNPHPTIEELLAYAAGELPPDEALLLEERIASDAAAAGVVARYRMIAGLVAADDSADPPEQALAAARALFQRQAARQPASTWLDRIDALIGHLIFDSRLQPLAVRRAAAADIVQMAFEAGEYEIELRATWSESDAGEGGTGDSGGGDSGGVGRWRVMGQISSMSDVEVESGTEIRLLRADSDAIVAKTTCDETGMFTIVAEPGVYDLGIRMEAAANQGRDRLIVLPKIDLP